MKFQAKVELNERWFDPEKGKDMNTMKVCVMIDSAVSYTDAEYLIARWAERNHEGVSFSINEIKKVKCGDIVLPAEGSEISDKHIWVNVFAKGFDPFLVLAESVQGAASQLISMDELRTLDLDITKCEKSAITDILYVKDFIQDLAFVELGLD